MAAPGFSCLVRKGGTPTVISLEPLSHVTAAQGGTASSTFRITDSAKRLIDPEAGFNLRFSAATGVFGTDYTNVDFLTGTFTIVGAYSAASLTFGGSYIPITTTSDLMLDSKSFNLNLSTNLIDTTVFTGTTQLAVVKRLPGLQDVSLQVTSLASKEELSTLQTAHENGTKVVTEVLMGDASTSKRFRGLCQIESIETSGSADGTAEVNLQFKIAAVKNTQTGLVPGYVFTIQP